MSKVLFFERGPEALNVDMEIDAVEHSERDLHVVALILKAAEQGASFLHGQRRAWKMQCDYAGMQRGDEKTSECGPHS
jgi:hypothetical protein